MFAELVTMEIQPVLIIGILVGVVCIWKIYKKIRKNILNAKKSDDIYPMF